MQTPTGSHSLLFETSGLMPAFLHMQTQVRSYKPPSAFTTRPLRPQSFSTEVPRSSFVARPLGTALPPRNSKALIWRATRVSIHSSVTHSTWLAQPYPVGRRRPAGDSVKVDPVHRHLLARLRFCCSLTLCNTACCIHNVGQSRYLRLMDLICANDGCPMSNELSVLVVSTQYPYPPIDGHKVRILNLLKHLPRNCSFHFLGFGAEIPEHCQEEYRTRLGPACKGVELVAESTVERCADLSLIGRLKNVVHPNALSIGHPYYSKEFERRIQAHVSSGRYEVIFFGGLGVFTHFIPSTTRAPYVVDIVDCPSLLTWSYLLQERHPVELLKKLVSHLWAKRYEQVHASKIANIVMITSVDAERIARSCPDSRIWVITNGVDARQLRRTHSPSSSSQAELLFTGVMDYLPNNVAMLHFITEILPRIKMKLPNVTLTIAGRNPTDELRSLASRTEGVRVTGFVDDLRCYFEEATVYVSPLLSGAGLKNKVLEAWSMALPVVATSVSCSGMAARDAQNVLIADAPAEFAAKVLALLSDSGLRERLSAEGRATVEREYSWQSRGAMLGSLLESIAIQKPVAPGTYRLA